MQQLKEKKWVAVLLGIILIYAAAFMAAGPAKEQLIEEAVQEAQKQQEARQQDQQPGYILIHTTDGETWGFYGDMKIISDEQDGTDIDIDMTGWLVGSTHPCYNPEAEEKGGEKH